MASPGSDEAESPLADLATFLDSPADARRRLPYVLGLFESDDERVRLAAAWTCCLAATTAPDVTDYLVRRLTDRLESGPGSPELRIVLEYVAARNPDRVEETLVELDEEAEETAGPAPSVRVGSLTRSHYHGRDLSRDGVGRTRMPEGAAEDPRQAYASEAEGADAGDESTTPNRDGDADAGEAGVADEDQNQTSADDPESGYMGNPREVVQRTTDVTPIASRSRFQKLHIVSSRERGRYADTYEALVGRGGDEQAVLFRMLRRPDHGDGRAYREGIRTELDRWASVDDHPHLVRVLDWGIEPQPWLVTSLAGVSLADRGRAEPGRALADGRHLADAVSHLHQHDVVHGGLDPANVAYPNEIVAGGDREPPLLDNVGLLHVFRHHFRPATCLDPRFAAPEYFDRSFGRVDHRTDVYGLGALLYRLFTGRPPYVGRFGEVREAVTADRVPRASDAVDADLPEGVDDVIRTAMAPAKLRRYETVEQLRGDLRGLAREADGAD